MATFEQALAVAAPAERNGDRTAWHVALEQAVAAYHGDLLPSCYDDWIAPVRERLHQQYLVALEQLSRLLEEKRDYAAATQRCTAFDPSRSLA